MAVTPRRCKNQKGSEIIFVSLRGSMFHIQMGGGMMYITLNELCSFMLVIVGVVSATSFINKK